MRESKIERYFMQQVMLAGGDTRKLRYFAAPDRMAIWPTSRYPAGSLIREFCASIHFVELKSPTGKVRVRQRREHDRLRALGCKVFVLYTKPQIDDYITRLRHV